MEGGTEITHLQFADDNVFFLNREVSQVKALKDILIMFSVVSGLKVNFSKSALFMWEVSREPGVGCRNTRILCAPVGILPSTYLGLPLGAENGSRVFWDCIGEDSGETCKLDVHSSLPGWEGDIDPKCTL